MPYFKEKFTTNDLRETLEDQFLIDLFQEILEAERQAQSHQCYFSPCGEVTERIIEEMTTTQAPENSSLNYRPQGLILVILVTFLLRIF